MAEKTRTSQLHKWENEFGREYTDRNLLTPQQVDELWLSNYGVSRTAVNHRFLSTVPKDAKILEVGCNIGNQLLLLQKMGFSDLHGIEVQDYALGLARSRVRGISLLKASAFDIPYPDQYFDLVFTSGVLIHISPSDLPLAISEMHRCTRSLVMGMEYYAAETTEVPYRENSGMLWKMNYAQEFLSRFPDLELVREERFPYLANHNVDSVFLLRKLAI